MCGVRERPDDRMRKRSGWCAAWTRPCGRRVAGWVGLALSLSLLFPHLAWTFEGSTFHPGGPGRTVDLIKEVPGDLGIVVRQVAGRGPLVIVIQDLHCQYQVQSRISDLLRHFALRYDLKLVAIEGASQAVNITKLSTFPEADVRRAVCETLMRRGRLSGAEHFAINADRPVRVQGIEDPTLYREDHARLLSFLNEESAGLVDDLRQVLGQLKLELFPFELLKFDGIRSSFESGVLSPLQYARALARSAALADVSLSEYPTLRTYLADGRLELRSGLDLDDLLRELSSLEARIRSGLYTTPEQRSLDDLWERLGLLERLLSASLTANELAQVRRDPEALSVRSFLEFLLRHAPAHEVPGPTLAELDRYRELALDFYRLADLRSHAFVTRTLGSMRHLRTPVAVLISGGYHTPLVLEGLRAAGASVLLIKPRQGRLDEQNPYFTLLYETRSPLERLLAQAAQAFALAPIFVQSEDPWQVPEESALLPDQAHTYMELEALLKSGTLAKLAATGVRNRSGLSEGYREVLTPRPATAEAAGRPGYPADAQRVEPDLGNTEDLDGAWIVPLRGLPAFLVIAPSSRSVYLPSPLETLEFEGQEARFYPNPMRKGVTSQLRKTAPRRPGTLRPVAAAKGLLRGLVRRMPGWETARAVYAEPVVRYLVDFVFTLPGVRVLTQGRRSADWKRTAASGRWSVPFFLINRLLIGGLSFLLAPWFLPAGLVRQGRVSPLLGAVFVGAALTLATAALTLTGPVSIAAVPLVLFLGLGVTNFPLIWKQVPKIAHTQGRPAQRFRMVPVFAALFQDLKLVVAIVPILAGFGPAAAGLPWMLGVAGVLLAILTVSTLTANQILAIVREGRVFSLAGIWRGIRQDLREQVSGNQRFFVAFKRQNQAAPRTGWLAVGLVVLARVFEYSTLFSAFGTFGAVMPYLLLGALLLLTGTSLLRSKDRTEWLETLVSRALRLVTAVLLVDVLKLPALLCVGGYLGGAAFGDQLSLLSLRTFKKVFTGLSLAEMLLSFLSWTKRRTATAQVRAPWPQRVRDLGRALAAKVRLGFGPGTPLRQAVLILVATSILFMGAQIAMPTLVFMAIQAVSSAFAAVQWYRLARNPQVSQRVKVMTMAGFLPSLLLGLGLGLSGAVVGANLLWPGALPAGLQALVPFLQTHVLSLQTEVLQTAYFIGFIYSLWGFSGVLKDQDRSRGINEAAPERVRTLEALVSRMLADAAVRLRPEDTIGPERLNGLGDIRKIHLIPRRSQPEWIIDEFNDGVYSEDQTVLFLEELFNVVSDSTVATLILRERLLQAGLLPLHRVNELVAEVTGFPLDRLEHLVRTVQDAAGPAEAYRTAFALDPALDTATQADRGRFQRQALERIYRIRFPVSPDAYLKEFSGSWKLLNEKVGLLQQAGVEPHPYLFRYGAERLTRMIAALDVPKRGSLRPSLKQMKEALRRTADAPVPARSTADALSYWRTSRDRVFATLARPVRERISGLQRVWQGLMRSLFFTPLDPSTGTPFLQRLWAGLLGPFRWSLQAARALIRFVTVVTDTSPIRVDDGNPYLVRLLREAALPDEETVRWMRPRLGFEVPWVRLRPMADAREQSRANRWQEVWTLARYFEEGEAGKPTLYVRGSLLATVQNGPPKEVRGLRAHGRRLRYRSAVWLLGLLLAHYGQKGYFSRAGSAEVQRSSREYLAWRIDHEREQSVVEASRLGIPALEAYSAPARRQGLSVFDLLRITDRALARLSPPTPGVLSVPDPLAEPLATQRERGATPNLSTALGLLTTFPGPPSDPTLALLGAALRESQELRPAPGGRIRTDLAAYWVHSRAQPVSIQPQRDSQTPALEPEEVYVFALPKTFRLLREKLDAALAPWQIGTSAPGPLALVGIEHRAAPARRERADTLQRLTALRAVLLAGEQAALGSWVKLAPEIGRELWNEALARAGEEDAVGCGLAPDLDEERGAVASGRTLVETVEGLPMIGRLVFDWSAPLPAAIRATPSGNMDFLTRGRVQPFTGMVPDPNTRPGRAWGGVGRRLWGMGSSLPGRLGRAVERSWRRNDPAGWLERIAARAPSPLATVLSDPNSPLVRTFLDWQVHPGTARERAWVRALFRNLSSAPSADRSSSFTTLTALCRTLPELNAIRIARWSRTENGALHEEEVLVPGLLVQPGQAGLLGVALDALRTLPVLLEWKGLERRRRLHFRDSAQAA